MDEEKEYKGSEERYTKPVFLTEELHKRVIELVEVAKKVTSDNYTIDKTLKTVFNNINYEEWIKDLKERVIKIEPLEIKEEK